MLEAKGWVGVECHKHLDNPSELNFHGCGKQKKDLFVSASEGVLGEEFAGEEVAPSSFLQTSSLYIVEEELWRGYQDSSHGILTTGTLALHGCVSVVP